jgi:alpha-galactosidase
MNKQVWEQALESVNNKTWIPPVIPEEIPHGDMPGDKVEIGETHIGKANIIFPELIRQIAPIAESSKNGKVVIAVCGGSGVGKSETASLLSYYFEQAGIGSYTLSGDNYPHRIPKYNDAERLRVFRNSAIRGLKDAESLTPEHFALVQKWQKEDTDASSEHVSENSWYADYLESGRKGLAGYLGSTNEIYFDEVSDIISKFKNGDEEIWLKRMGRDETELWYEKVDFSEKSVLVIEWTHGNSDHITGVDAPILLNSTPQETLAHRRSRNRDGAVDSPFTTMVLELEQNMLEQQAKKAKIIVAKSGELLSYAEYQELMKEAKAALSK